MRPAVFWLSKRSKPDEGKGCNEMKMQEIRELAKGKGVATGKLKKTELIKSIQKAERYSDCYATPYGRECNQVNCLWREDCMKAV